MMETINVSDKSDAISKQMKLNRDIHMKEIIDLKESQTAYITQYELKIADLIKQKDNAHERIEALEDELNKYKCEIESLVEHDRLNKREYELKANIMKYEREKEIEQMLNKIKNLNIQHDAEINCINEQKDRDINDLRHIYMDGLNNLKTCHLKEKNQLEEGISKLQIKVEKAINNIVFSDSSLPSVRRENNLESIPSERESIYSDNSSRLQMLASSELEDSCKFNVEKVMEENTSLKEQLNNIKTNILPAKDEQINTLDSQLSKAKETIKTQKQELKKSKKLLNVSNEKLDNLKKSLKLIESGCNSPKEKQVKQKPKDYKNNSMHYPCSMLNSEVKVCDFDNKIFMTRRELESVVNTPSKEIEYKNAKDFSSNKSMIYELTNLPIELSQIQMSNTKHISLIANRIETEVSDGEIYLKHFFRLKENNDHSKSCKTEQPCSRNSSINRSTNTIGLNTVKKNLNDTFNNYEHVRYSVRENSNERTEKTVSGSYKLR